MRTVVLFLGLSYMLYVTGSFTEIVNGFGIGAFDFMKVIKSIPAGFWFLVATWDIIDICIKK